MSNLAIELREEQTQVIAGLPYLTLQINHNVTVALPLKIVRETLVLAAERFTQMPNVHPCLMGLVEHRSNAFWVLDLPQLLGFASLDSTSTETHIAILQIGDVFLGFGVHQIGRVAHFAETEVTSSEELSKTKISIETMPFLRGYVVPPEGSNAYILDAEAIASYRFAV